MAKKKAQKKSQNKSAKVAGKKSTKTGKAAVKASGKKPTVSGKEAAQTKAKAGAKSKVNGQTKASAKTKPSAPTKAPSQAPRTARSNTSRTLAFTPLRDFVLIERMGDAERTAGGIYIPQTAMEKPMMGKVLSVGPGSFDKKGRKRLLDVKVGDKVLFGKYSGTDIQMGGQSLLVLKESDILGVSSEEAK